MTRAEIRSKFDEIVAFAEVEKFIDTPVKRYSSGMYVRLAFAVAAHLEPDVLIVDEVLAVGDAAFQRKCLGKMQDVARGDRAVIVVSHNMSIVTQLCEKVIWLDSGTLKDSGPTARVVSAYLSQGLANAATWRPAKPSSSEFTYHEVRIENGAGGGAFAADEPVKIVFDYSVATKISPGRLSLRVTRDDGLVLLTSSNTDVLQNANTPWTLGDHRVSVTIPPDLLAPATYYVSISEPVAGVNTVHENVLSFTVTDQNSLVTRDRREGVIAPILIWNSESP
jgi:lipopolysaccharide transport system ATP-binding protein